MKQITQELLATLTFILIVDFTRGARVRKDGEQERDVEQRINKTVYETGNILQLKGAPTQYELVGHINGSGDGCECCGTPLESIEAVAHISQLFENESNQFLSAVFAETVKSDGSGRKLLALDADGQLHESTDHGKTWNPVSPNE